MPVKDLAAAEEDKISAQGAGSIGLAEDDPNASNLGENADLIYQDRKKEIETKFAEREKPFEEKKKTPILGMEKHADQVPTHNKLTRIISQGINGEEPKCWSETHGGFDNDVRTMNTLLRNILKTEPKRLFTAEDLDY